MGTLFVFRNIRIVIHTKDHAPPHVHGISPNGEVKINLETLECFFCRGYTERDLKMIIEFVSEKRETLLEAWNEIHAKKRY